MAEVVKDVVETSCVDLEGCIRAKIDKTDSSWPPLKPATVAHKKKIGKEKMLQVTGLMKMSVDHKVSAGGGEIVGEVGIWDKKVLEYAPSHEFGTDDGVIPERSFIRSTYDEEIDRISGDAIDILGDAIEGFWTDKPVKTPKTAKRKA
jgi:hypothetical protein